MARTESTMLDLGTPAPDFRLPNTNRNAGTETVSLADFSDARVLVVIFMCNHCPYVKHIRDGLVRFARDYAGKGVGVVAISANDVETHPDDSPGRMTAEAQQFGYPFPYLYDETQEVAKTYHAACTPDFFVFDGARRLAYRGQFDDSRPGNDRPVTGADLRAAVDELLAGRAVPAEQTPSIGCNIKWKRGAEPDYFAAAG